LAQRGILAEADGGVVLLAMAERLTAGTVARITAVLDSGESVMQRDGLAQTSPARIGVVAFDEGIDDDERLAAPLMDRLAFHLTLDDEAAFEPPDAEAILAARARLPRVTVGDDVLETLCGTAMALGIDSIRAPLLAVRVARAAAALDGRNTVLAEDAAVAARLVLAPRATRMPAPPPDESPPDESETPPDSSPETPPESPPESNESSDSPPESDADQQQPGPLADMVLEAALAAIPAGLLDMLRGAAGKPRGGAAGRVGAPRNAGARGRPAGVRAGEPRGALRLNLIETLRAAAPWQRLRQRDGRIGIQVRSSDYRVTHLKQKAETTTIFVVDASGSQAFNRLAEAKGAVELLLADCYVRRDQVAVLAFRGKEAQLLLPPTRSLVRAKRSLASLPGGGGTPLALGIDAGRELADSVRRRGGTPTLVLLTDGRPNVGRDGKGGRAAAERDADDAARLVRQAGHAVLLIDTSPRPVPAGQRLAAEMGARYLALPFADARSLSRSVKAAMA
jgi:magnesium chelatase subunit D